MAVGYDQAELDPKAEVTFWVPKYSLVFVTLSFGSSPGAPPTSPAALPSPADPAGDLDGVVSALLRPAGGEKATLVPDGPRCVPMRQAPPAIVSGGAERRKDGDTEPGREKPAVVRGSAGRDGLWDAVPGTGVAPPPARAR